MSDNEDNEFNDLKPIEQSIMEMDLIVKFGVCVVCVKNKDN